jgi:hypothetical protein
MLTRTTKASTPPPLPPKIEIVVEPTPEPVVRAAHRGSDEPATETFNSPGLDSSTIGMRSCSPYKTHDLPGTKPLFRSNLRIRDHCPTRDGCPRRVQTTHKLGTTGKHEILSFDEGILHPLILIKSHC